MLCRIHQILAGNSVSLAVDAHLVCTRPHTVRVIGIGHIIGRRKTPNALSVHQEGDVFHMVVLVPGQHVEHHPPVKLADFRSGDPQPPHHLGCLFVAVHAGLIEIKMSDGAQRLHVQLPSGLRLPVESPGHKVKAPLLLIQPAIAHSNSGVAGHQVIAILNSRILRGVLPLFVAVTADAVKFHQPVIISFSRLDLAGANVAGLLVPGDNRLGAGAAGRGAHLNDFLHGIFAGRDVHFLPGSQDLRSQLHQLINLNALRFRGTGAASRYIL